MPKTKNAMRSWVLWGDLPYTAKVQARTKSEARAAFKKLLSRVGGKLLRLPVGVTCRLSNRVISEGT
jgi:hypothetical protein